MERCYRAIAGLCVAMVLTIVAPLFQVARAESLPSLTLAFQAITSNNPSSVADGEANLRMEVIDLGSSLGSNHARFRFTNNSAASSLTDVYFDDGTLLGISQIASSSGVNFSQGATPPNLPGGNNMTPKFETTQGFLADSDAPVSPNGVQHGEWLAIDFQLLPGKTFLDLLDSLALPAGGEWLRVGLHVQSFAGGFSESFVNESEFSYVVSSIPEPREHAFLLAGLSALGLLFRRRRLDC
jgi:hypothetical protein